jgi:molecular chaperone HtpG
VERLLHERGQSLQRVKRILEVNPTHPVIEHLKALHEREPGAQQVSEWLEILYDQALPTGGSSVEDRKSSPVPVVTSRARCAEVHGFP